jgi:hypothetical protein
MSNITTDFINATKKIHADVRALLVTLRLVREDVKFIRDQGTASNHTTEAAKEQPADHSVVSSGEQGKTHNARQQTLDEKRFGLEQDAFKVGKWTLAVLALYTALTAYQSCQAKRSADATVIAANAAKNSADTAKDTLTRSQRPWLGIDHAPTITFYPVGAVPAATAVVIRNFGPLPALGVGYDLRTLNFHSSVADYNKVLDNSCNIAELSTMKYGGTAFGPSIFPNQLFTMFSATQEGGTPYNERIGDASEFIIIGCIAYIDQVSDKPIHHTTLCFNSGTHSYADFRAQKTEGQGRWFNDCNFGHRVD